MSADRAVFVMVVAGVAFYGFYMLGYKHGTESAHKDCPAQTGVRLKYIQETGGEVQCHYTSLPATRIRGSVPRAAY